MKKSRLILNLLLVPSIISLSSCGSVSSPFVEPLISTYKVKFYGKEYDKNDVDNVNNTLIYESTVYEHETAVLPDTIAKPTKESTTYKVYNFSGWVDSNGNTIGASDVTDNISLYPNFIEEDRYYTVNYYDNDHETLLYTESVKAGNNSSFKGSVAPSKSSDTLYSYEFNGNWEIDSIYQSSLNNILYDINCYPLFTQSTRKYLVRFFSGEGSQIILDQQSFEAGTYISYPSYNSVPTKESEEYNEDYDRVYTFDYWETYENGRYSQFNITQTRLTSDLDLYAHFSYTTKLNDKALTRNYILNHTNSNYDNIEEGYKFAIFGNSYLIGYSETEKNFMLYSEKAGSFNVLIKNDDGYTYVTTTNTKLELKFEYGNIGAYSGKFTYTLNLKNSGSSTTTPLDIEATFNFSLLSSNILSVSAVSPSTLGDTNYNTYSDSIESELSLTAYNISTLMSSFLSSITDLSGNTSLF